MPPDRYRIFVNATPVEAAAGEPAIDAIARWDPVMAEQLRGGARALTDSRGLVAPIETPVHAGAIFRVVSNRQLRDTDDPFAEA